MQKFHLIKTWLHLYLVLWCALCGAVPLELAEHRALMVVYDKIMPPLDTRSYPRFGANEECQGPTDNIQCNNGKVVSLHFPGNYVQIVPSQIGQLTSLTSLSFYYNKLLQSLPSQIGQLTLLTKLDLSSNNLESVPSEIFQLVNLTYLYLHNIDLESIPSQIGQLTSLTLLNLGDNNLQSVPSQIGQLTSLEALYLYKNGLQILPPQIGRLVNLTVLVLFENGLQSLPPQIGQLTSMTALGLDDNQLQSLPSQIGQLTSLVHLYLSINQLTSIPSEFNRLNLLESFGIYHNQLRGVPFPLSYTPSGSCKAQGLYRVGDTTYGDTNCFTTCPSGCCTSEFRWPHCAVCAPGQHTTLQACSIEFNKCELATDVELELCGCLATYDDCVRDNICGEADEQKSFIDALEQAATSFNTAFGCDEQSPSPSSLPIEILIGAIAGGVVLLVACFFLFVCLTRRRKNKNNKNSKKTHSTETEIDTETGQIELNTFSSTTPLPSSNQLHVPNDSDSDSDSDSNFDSKPLLSKQALVEQEP